MADSSFDIVSKFDAQEVDNALGQANKELSTRYDFKGVDASVQWQGKEAIVVTAQSEDRVKAAYEVLIERLIRRGIDAKALETSEPKASGKTYSITANLRQGIPSDEAKKINSIIRNEGPKGVKSQTNGDEIRVSSKSRNDLQAVIALLKNKDLPIALQFTNYR